MLWDNERNNGSTYYYYPESSPPECSVINFPVGILRPDWLSGAKYKGVEEYNGHQVRVCVVVLKAYTEGGLSLVGCVKSFD